MSRKGKLAIAIVLILGFSDLVFMAAVYGLSYTPAAAAFLSCQPEHPNFERALRLSLAQNKRLAAKLRAHGLSIPTSDADLKNDVEKAPQVVDGMAGR